MSFFGKTGKYFDSLFDLYKCMFMHCSTYTVQK